MIDDKRKQVFAKIARGKIIIKKYCPDCRDISGIYVLTREDENGFKYAYIGQSKKVMTRLAQHYATGFQEIDFSLRKHGFYDEERNPTGWKIEWKCVPIEKLDIEEQQQIFLYHKKGYQLKNKTGGSQGKGKRDISEQMKKGYQEGLHNGYQNARKEIKHLFDLHLTYGVKKQGNKIQEKALKKFEEFIGGDDE